MGCNSNYMEPKQEEANSRRTAENLAYALDKLGKPVPAEVTKAAGHIYGNASMLNELVVSLCDLCRGMSNAQQSQIIYDGRDARARQLAVWWDAHLKADKDRLLEEKVDALKKDIDQKVDDFRKQLINGLPEEQRALLD